MRTGICKACGQGGLERLEFASGEFVYIDRDTHKRHECDGTAVLAAVNGNGSGHIDWSEVRKIAADEIAHTPTNGNGASVSVADVRPVVDSVLGDLIPDTVGAAVATSRGLIREIATEAVKNLLPDRHEIVLVDGNGAEIGKAEGRAHRDLETLLNLAALRLNIMVVGPAGSGKTTAARTAAKLLALDYYERSMGPQTSQWDLLGYLSPDGVYVPGILRTAYEHGGVLMLDEIDNANASVLTVLNSAVANGHCTFPDGEVKRHADFVLIASGNTYGRGSDRLYVGRQPLDAATLDRFVVLDWDYDESAELAWAGDDSEEWVAYVQGIRRKASALGKRIIVSPRSSIFGAKLLRSGKFTRAQVEDMALWRGISTDDRRALTA